MNKFIIIDILYFFEHWLLINNLLLIHVLKVVNCSKCNKIIDIRRDFTDNLVQSFHYTYKKTESQEDEIT